MSYKKIFFFLVALFMGSVQLQAVTFGISLNIFDPNANTNGNTKGPVVFPSVTFDDETNVLELSSLFVIGQATMTIRDADGNVLTTSTFYFGSSQTFPLSDTVVADMYSIELLYDNRHLIGYFDFGEDD